MKRGRTRKINITRGRNDEIGEIEEQENEKEQILQRKRR